MEKKWWQQAVVYQIYPKSFYDANGDGIGDLAGILQKLDYLKDLGVNVLWLCPVFCSPMDDNGYDISDYTQIDPRFGTNADMDRLIAEASARGMKILMDLVVNHTSDEHAWFQGALADPDPNGPYAGYYFFREGKDGNPPNNLRSFFGGSAWERIGETNRFYLHAFSKKQPDLNWENPVLRAEIYRMVNDWLDKGLGGFRIDAISNIKKNEAALARNKFPVDGEDGLCYLGKWIVNQPGIETFLSELTEKTFRPHDSMTVAEANVPQELLEKFIGDDGFFSMVFDFSYADLDVPATGEWFKPVPWTVAKLRSLIFRNQLNTQKIGWGAPYLENHDQPRSLNKYIPASDIGYASTTMLASLYFMLRGTPFIYQGQELGMSNCRMRMDEYDDIATHDQFRRALLAGISEDHAMEFMYRRSRDNSRTPFHWDASENAGFTKGKPWLKVNPNYRTINVQAQMQAPQSVLAYYKKLIFLRQHSEWSDALTYGEFQPALEAYETLIAYRRIASDKSVWVIHNFSAFPCEIEQEDVSGEMILSNLDVGARQGKWVLQPYQSLILGER
jgi:glycosidase